MTFEEWEETVPREIRDDSLWKLQAYRLGLFFADLAWADSAKLLKDRRTVRIAGQLMGAVGGISSTLSEGYSRNTGRERARFYEYSLGSARESRDWYYQTRQLLGPSVTQLRLKLATRIIKLLLKMIPDQRRRNQKLSGEEPIT